MIHPGLATRTQIHVRIPALACYRNKDKPRRSSQGRRGFFVGQLPQARGVLPTYLSADRVSGGEDAGQDGLLLAGRRHHAPSIRVEMASPESSTPPS